ncbi:unnamed protein product [Somion occarium]|uniref:AT-hook motif nuclear-localized protein n=1 Tax=Somion occarium TaxID=3059160 RepID=A0ABP1D4Z7_9APHY
MFNGFHSPIPPSDAELATQTLNEESSYRFPSFSANDAVTLGLSLRKRFRASTRHAKGKGLVISIQTIAGHTLFACTVGDLGGISGVGDVSLDSWTCLDGMIAVVRRTGHSSYYVEKGMGAMGKTPKQLGIPGDYRINGGAFPVWLENAPCCPIAVIACYSGSSADDHHLVVNSIRDYLKKMARDSNPPPPPSTSTAVPMPAPSTDRDSAMWMREPAASSLMHGRDDYSHETEHDRRDYDQ